jgi:gluconate kinase
MPAALLPSQFAALEVPDDALVVDIRDAVSMQVARICDGLSITTV